MNELKIKELKELDKSGFYTEYNVGETEFGEMQRGWLLKHESGAVYLAKRGNIRYFKTLNAIKNAMEEIGAEGFFVAF